MKIYKVITSKPDGFSETKIFLSKSKTKLMSDLKIKSVYGRYIIEDVTEKYIRLFAESPEIKKMMEEKKNNKSEAAKYYGFKCLYENYLLSVSKRKNKNI